MFIFLPFSQFLAPLKINFSYYFVRQKFSKSITIIIGSVLPKCFRCMKKSCITHPLTHLLMWFVSLRDIGHQQQLFSFIFCIELWTKLFKGVHMISFGKFIPHCTTPCIPESIHRMFICRYYIYLCGECDQFNSIFNAHISLFQIGHTHQFFIWYYGGNG